MATPRDLARAARRSVMQMAQKQGINLDAERRRPTSNARTMTVAALRLISDATPRFDSDGLVVDAPPTGAFNGVNTTFTLSAAVLGQNVAAVHTVQSTGVQTSLTRSAGSSPAAGEFFFDTNNPTVIVVGTPPQAADGLVVVFKAAR